MEQKPIGLIGAMKIEVDAILAALENTRQETHGGMAFTQGVLSGVEVVVAQCSPGKVNAALCTQAMIDRYSPRLVLNLGVAGGIGENVHIGDVVIATACVEYDFDTSALDQWPAGQLTLPGYEEPMRFLPCGQTLAHILSRAAEGLYGRAHLGIVATGDKFVADPHFGDYLQKEFGAGIPNCMVIDSKDEALKEELVAAFSSELIRFYYGRDLIGNEIGGASKNVIGIAAGMLDGLGLSSLKGALMSRGTREIARLIKALGGNELSAYGLCHLGDYEATVFSPYSHNRRFGEAFVTGEPYGELAEGYATVKALVKLGEDRWVALPICQAVYQVLYQGADPRATLDGLFSRSLKQEF